MRLHTTNGKVKTIDARTVRIAITTKDVATLFNWTESKVLRKMRSGDLVFTGDAVTDLTNLMKIKANQQVKL